MSYTITNMWEHIYYQIQAQITSQVPAIKYIASDLGQLEVLPRPPITFPALLIDFQSTKYSELSAGAQLADLSMIVFRLAFNPYTKDSNITAAASKAVALQFYKIEQQVHEALQGWCGDGTFANFTRISADSEKRPDTLRVRQIVYTTTWKDDSTQILPTPASPKINPNLTI